MGLGSVEYRRPLRAKAAVAMFVAFAVTLAGCTSTKVSNELRDIQKIPVPKVSVATNVLACVSDMVADYRRASTNIDSPKPIRIALVSVKDATNVSSQTYPDSEIPSDMTEMALSVISNLGGPVRVVHVPRGDEYLDAARAGSNESLHRYFLKFLPSHYRGDTLLLYGALTEYDRFVRGKTRTAELSSELGSGQYQTQIEAEAVWIRNMARMTMDFRVVHPGVGDIINHSSSSNTLTLFQSGKDRSFGLSVDGTAIGYSTSKNEIDARHDALRTLVELGIAEAVGRYFYVPYWKCFPGYDPTQLVRFLDITTMPDDELLRFSPFKLRADGTTDEAEPGKEKADTDQGIDFRDDDLILSVMTNYLYGEYLHNGTRQYELRGETDLRVDKIKNKDVFIDGLETMRKRILSLYRRNIDRFAESDDPAILSELIGYYRKNNVIRESDVENSFNTYLALWLNAPIARHASRYH